MSGDVAVYLERKRGAVTELSRRAAGLAWELARRAGGRALGLAFEEPAEENDAVWGGLPLDLIHIVPLEAPDDFRGDVQARALARAAGELRPSVLIIGASDRGKDLAPSAAALLNTGLTADCTALEIGTDGLLTQIRPAFGGNVMAEILTPGTRPQMATVRAAPAFTAKADGPAEIVRRAPPEMDPTSRITVLSREKREDSPALTEAKILVVAGRGLKAAEDLDWCRALADRLGGELAGTRGLVEKGWLPPERQIGLSGLAVSPELAITLGVSGSVQFLAGLTGARRIIALNKDPEARIFSVADVSLCVDLYEVLPEILNRFDKPAAGRP